VCVYGAKVISSAGRHRPVTRVATASSTTVRRGGGRNVNTTHGTVISRTSWLLLLLLLFINTAHGPTTWRSSSRATTTLPAFLHRLYYSPCNARTKPCWYVLRCGAGFEERVLNRPILFLLLLLSLCTGVSNSSHAV